MDSYCVLVDVGNEVFVFNDGETIFKGFVRTEHLVVKANSKGSALESVKQILKNAYESKLDYNGDEAEDFSDVVFWGGVILGCYKLEN